jgi:NADPH:quinone reductase
VKITLARVLGPSETRARVAVRSVRPYESTIRLARAPCRAATESTARASIPVMKAIQVQKTGGPEVLTLVDLPAPKPGANEALIQVKAIGVNFIDVYFREGRYPAQLPFIDGQEAAGIVTEVGPGVTTVKAGDRVAYTGRLGSYAEYAIVAADRLVKIPDQLDFREAAAAMLQGMTAHYLIHSSYPLKRGEIALIHAAAGGVGLLAVQMAKMVGARVIGTAGTPDKAQLARDAGADEVILYREQDFAEETKRLTEGKGVHVVYDGVGKDTFDKDLDVLRPRGYLVLFGGSSGAVPPFDLIKLSQKGSLFLTRPTLVHYIATREELEHRANDVLGWIASGKLKLRIEHTYSLADAAQAHRDLEARKTTGKLILLP